MKFSLLKKDSKTNDYFINDDSQGYIIKKDFFSIVLLMKVIVASIYAFGLGYSLFYFGDDFIKVGIKFLVLLVVLYFISEIPYAFLKAIFFPNPFKKDVVKLEFNPLNMNIYVSSNKPVKKVRLIVSLILPFILLGFIPTIVNYILEFNIYIYAIASSCAIISVPDLIFSILISIDDSIGEKLIVTPFAYVDSNISVTEICVDLDKENDSECEDEYCYQILENINEGETKKTLKDENKNKNKDIDIEYIKEMIFHIDE